MDIKRKKKEKRIQLFGGLIGICVALVSLFYFFHTEKAETEKRMVEIVNYVKVQCSTYTHYNESSESKSLLRAIESARQMSTNIDMEIENGGHLSQEFLKENLQTLWVDGILVLDAVGKTDCEYSMDESLTGEITAYLQKDIIMDFAGYEERSYSERFTREDGSYIDIAACARKDAPGIVAIYYYTPPEFARNYTLTIQGLLNGYSIQKDGTVIVADDGIVVASNDESLLGQNTADNEVVQAMKKHTDSQHIYHLKNEGTRCYGIMLKQRDYYIYAYLPDTEVFHNLPLNVAGVIFIYLLIFSIFWFWAYRTNLTHRKQEQKKDEKYKAELLIAAKKAEAANEAKTEFLQRMSHDIRTPINGICGLVDMADHYADDMEKQTEYRTKIKEAWKLVDCDSLDNAADMVIQEKADCFLMGASQALIYDNSQNFKSVPLTKTMEACFTVREGEGSLLSILNKTIKAMPFDMLTSALAIYDSTADKVTFSDFIKDNLLVFFATVGFLALSIIGIILVLLRKARKAEAVAKLAAKDTKKLNDKLEIALKKAEDASLAKTRCRIRIRHAYRSLQ